MANDTEEIMQLKKEIALLKWKLKVEVASKNKAIKQLEDNVIDKIDGINAYINIGGVEEGGVGSKVFDFFNEKKRVKHDYKRKSFSELFWIRKGDIVETKKDRTEKNVISIAAFFLIICAVVFFVIGFIYK